MCGIFGFAVEPDSNARIKDLAQITKRLFLLSESRGKEASGLAIKTADNILVLKAPTSASELLKKKDYKKLWNDFSNSGVIPNALIGHARLVTNGQAFDNRNNQPVIKGGVVGVHNGIIVNVAELWKTLGVQNKESEVDTEALLSLIMNSLNDSRPEKAVGDSFDSLKGSASIAVLFKSFNMLVLATNTGSLYSYLKYSNPRIILFASERYILEELFAKEKFLGLVDSASIRHIKPGSGYAINLTNFEGQEFSLKKVKNEPVAKKSQETAILELTPAQIVTNIQSDSGPAMISKVDLGISLADIASIKRCQRCILPVTMPFINFNSDGICNYCLNYQPMRVKGKEFLEKELFTLASDENKPDVLVTFSGGRDSSYALYYLKEKLGLNPIAYSYDWGMLTDLGRRNQARMCGELGVEHIIISADITRKRLNIKKNVIAWLKKPDLGTVPLFMAGDKQFFYYANKLKNRLNIRTTIFAENPLEKTYFKSGFSGVRPDFYSDNIHALAGKNKLTLAAYYAKKYLENPAYLNSSIFDTLGAYISYYFIPHDYLYFFSYIRWVEQEIVDTLVNNFDWELAEDTKTSWRIGDGTAAFYNYIYYRVAGFTENDTFRSNQIREGALSRDEALALANRDNEVRLPSFFWYCETIGIDPLRAIEVIKAMPRFY